MATNPSTRPKCADTTQTMATASWGTNACLCTEKGSLKKSAILIPRTQEMDVAAEFVEAADSIQIWRAPTQAGAEATASLKCTKTSTKPPSLTELQPCRMEPLPFNSQPNNPLCSSSHLEANTTSKTNKEVACEVVAEVATKAEAFTRNVPSSPDLTTIIRASSSKWAAVCMVRTNRDRTCTPRAKRTIKPSFASTSFKTSVLMKGSVVLHMVKPNLGRNNQCNNNNRPTTKGNSKTTATRLPNRTMGKVATKSRFTCQFNRTMLLPTKTTTVDSNSSSNRGSLLMGCIHNIKTTKWVTTCKMSTSSQTTSCKTTKLSHQYAESCSTKRTPRVKLSVRE